MRDPPRRTVWACAKHPRKPMEVSKSTLVLGVQNQPFWHQKKKILNYPLGTFKVLIFRSKNNSRSSCHRDKGACCPGWNGSHGSWVFLAALTAKWAPLPPAGGGEWRDTEVPEAASCLQSLGINDFASSFALPKKDNAAHSSAICHCCSVPCGDNM